jgi:hypothetical protein
MTDEIGTDTPQALVLANGSRLEMERSVAGAKLALRSPDGRAELEIELVLTAAGPVLRAKAAALDIDVAHDLVARCENFRVEAAQNIELVSQKNLGLRAQRDLSVTAATGSVRVHANDDVQLLGEQVLLNTERQAELPLWLGAPPPVMGMVAATDSSGDPELLETIAERS